MVILPIIICLLLSALFSGMEIAFLATTKTELQVLETRTNRKRPRLQTFYDQRDSVITSLLIGNNVVLVLLAWFATKQIERLPIGFNSESSQVLFETLSLTAIVLVFGEFFPKLIFRRFAARILHILAPLLYLQVALLRPLTYVFKKVSGWIIHPFVKGLVAEKNEPEAGAEDLENFIRQQSNLTEGGDDELNVDFFKNALILKDVRVRECLVPRTSIVAHDLSEGKDALRQKFLDSMHSRIVVYHDDIDHIVGYVHHFEVLASRTSIEALIRPLYVTPESKSARDLLEDMLSGHFHMAWVVDEYGGTAGIVTLEDIVEEVVGEIEDEHDEAQAPFRPMGKKTWSIEGSVEIDLLNEQLSLAIPKGDYETISGYIFHGMGEIPKKGQRFTVDHFALEIVDRSASRIHRLKLTDCRS
ncbi:MAG: hemolysin family protein [Chitinophagales bacterium]